jgi:hypothetical protein
MAFSTSATTVTASGSTGGVVQATGPYRSSRNPKVCVFLKRGTRFPADPVDGRSTSWAMGSDKLASDATASTL